MSTCLVNIISNTSFPFVSNKSKAHPNTLIGADQDSFRVNAPLFVVQVEGSTQTHITTFIFIFIVPSTTINIKNLRPSFLLTRPTLTLPGVLPDNNESPQQAVSDDKSVSPIKPLLRSIPISPDRLTLPDRLTGPDWTFPLSPG
jgi:hypothetical protein